MRALFRLLGWMACGLLCMAVALQLWSTSPQIVGGDGAGPGGHSVPVLHAPARAPPVTGPARPNAGNDLPEAGSSGREPDPCPGPSACLDPPRDPDSTPDLSFPPTPSPDSDSAPNRDLGTASGPTALRTPPSDPNLHPTKITDADQLTEEGTKAEAVAADDKHERQPVADSRAGPATAAPVDLAAQSTAGGTPALSHGSMLCLRTCH